MKKIAIFVLLISIILGIWLVAKDKKNEKFTKAEQEWIDQLSENDKKYFLSNTELHSLLKEEKFQKEKLTEYIKLHRNNHTLKNKELIMAVDYNLQNEDIPITPTVFSFLEVEGFNTMYLKRYLAYQENNSSLSADKVVKLVNQDVDNITMEYNDSIEAFLKAEYFIKNNLERYLNYQNKYNTDVETTVAYVNSNLDYEYYTNTKSTDLDKGILMIVNKYYALDRNYVPDNLITIESKYGVNLQMNKEAYEAFKKMADAAQKEGLTLYIQSPYRSYQTQQRLYQNYSKKDGIVLADTYSARPGYSEHQTGLAIDIVNGPGRSLASFEGTKEFQWMNKNAHQYGFILRYKDGKEKITGYQYEPWHYRYVGIETATKIKELDITFDEYYPYYIE